MRYAVLLLLCLGCASTAPETDVAPPGEAPEGGAVVVEMTDPVPAPEPEPKRVVFPERPELEDVLARAATVPLVEAAQALVLSRQGEVKQASLAPNPRLAMSVQGWDLDNFSDGPGRRWIRLYQKFETGGKRGARTEMAEWRVKEASANERFERFRVAEAAAASHQEAAVYQQLVVIRSESLETQRELLALKSAQVRSGRENAR